MKKLFKSNSSLSFLLSFVLIAAMVLSLSGCSSQPSNAEISPSAPVSVNPSGEPTELGEGRTQFNLEVVTEDGETAYFTVNTDEKTVGAALLALGLISGDDGEFGLYVKTVNGVTADFDADGTYWAFYIGGEYASAGVDATEISAGTTYSLKIEK